METVATVPYPKSKQQDEAYIPASRKNPSIKPSSRLIPAPSCLKLFKPKCSYHCLIQPSRRYRLFANTHRWCHPFQGGFCALQFIYTWIRFLSNPSLFVSLSQRHGPNMLRTASEIYQILNINIMVLLLTAL